MKTRAKALVVMLVLAGTLILANLAPAAAGPGAQRPGGEHTLSRTNVGPPLPPPEATPQPASATAPPAPGLQIVAGTVAPETGVRLDSSGEVHYSGSASASMTTERHGDTVVTTMVPRH